MAMWVINYDIRPVRKYGVSESTVRGIIKNCKEAKVVDEKLEELPRKERELKTLFPSELDKNVVSMIKNMTQAGFAVNYNTQIDKGIVLANDSSFLKENSGSLELSYTWGQSMFRKIGFTKGQQQHLRSQWLLVF